MQYILQFRMAEISECIIMNNYSIITIFLIATLVCSFVMACGDVNSQQVTAVSSQEYYEKYRHLLDDGEALIIDGRTEQMYSAGHLKNAINIDADDPRLISLLEQHLDEPLIVVYCTTVRRTHKIVNTLLGMYDGEIIYITDGLRGWQLNGFPLQ